MTSKEPARSCEDIDPTELEFAEVKALCAGDPRIREKMELDVVVLKLRVLKNDYDTQHYQLADSLLKHYPNEIADVTERFTGISADADTYKAQKARCVETKIVNGTAHSTTGFPGMTINGVTHVEKETAAKMLLECCSGITGKDEKPVGEYMGFKLALRFEPEDKKFSLLIRGKMTYTIDLGSDAFGNISRINNALESLDGRAENQRLELENLNRQVEAIKEELAKPFEEEQELCDKEVRLALLNTELNLDNKGGEDIIDEEDESVGDIGDGDFGDIGEDCDEDMDGDDLGFDDDSDGDEDRAAPVNRLAACAKTEPSFVDNIRNRGERKRESAQSSVKAADVGVGVEH